MATVDELKILIKAETKDLRKKLDETNRKLDQTSKKSSKAGTDMSAAFKKAAIGAAALTAVAIKVSSVIAKVGSQFEDLKDSLDTVFGSAQAGDKAMSRVLEFAQTTPFQVETATKAFISLKSAGIEPTNRMLQVFADTASTSVDQLGVFEALIRTVQRSAGGGLGLEELNMIADRGIDVFGGLQQELGITRSEVAQFGATAEGAKLITDALVNSLERQFGGAMANKMDNLSTKTSNMTIAFKQLADEIFRSGLGALFKNMADSMTETANAATRLIAAAGGRGTGVEMTEDPAKNIENLIELQKKLEAKQDRSITGLQGSTSRLLQGSAGLTHQEQHQLNFIAHEIKNQERLLEELTNGYKKLTNAEKEDLKVQGQLMQSFSFIRGVVDKHKGDTDELAFAQANLTEIFQKNQEAFAIMGVSEEQVGEILKELAKDTDELAERFGELAPVIAEATNKFTNDFVQSLMDGENAMDSFKNLFKDMARQIIASALQMQIIKPIMDAMFTAVGLPVGEKAGGGRVQKGQPTLVGERGAEIFIPNTGGTIMNNMNSKNALAGGGGVTVVQNNNFALGVGATARAEVAKLLPQIQESSKAAVLEAAARGGSFRRGLMGG